MSLLPTEKKMIFFISTEKFMETIIVDLHGITTFVYKHNVGKISKNG